MLLMATNSNCAREQANLLSRARALLNDTNEQRTRAHRGAQWGA